MLRSLHRKCGRSSKKRRRGKNRCKGSERQAEEAAEKAKDSVRVEIPYVIKEASEHSVAILGIFAGIVLVVVAGLFCSLSVLESLYNTNIFKVLCVSSLVGLICIYLPALMFYYIDKLGGNRYRFGYLFLKVKYISIVLISTMAVSGTFYFIISDKNTYQNQPLSQSDVNLSGNISVSASSKDTSSIVETSNDSETLDDSSGTETESKVDNGYPALESGE